MLFDDCLFVKSKFANDEDLFIFWPDYSYGFVFGLLLNSTELNWIHLNVFSFYKSFCLFFGSD